ncbi:MAG: response regulator transcription factor [Pyrinomonadaceae bacterium]
MNKILVVEDEAHIADGIRFNLEAEGFLVDVAEDGEAALDLLFDDNAKFDAIVLDVMLPKFNGFEIAQKLRSAENYTPILMLTARSRPEDVLLGFEAGTDDYLPKPFELSIFIARLKGLLRRQKWSQNTASGEQENDSDIFTLKDKTIDFTNLELKTAEETIQLTLMEAKLLRHLIQNHGNAVSRKEILEEVWGLHEETDTRAIDNFIVRLRRYLEDDPTNPKILETVRGVGYRFVNFDS